MWNKIKVWSSLNNIIIKLRVYFQIISGKDFSKIIGGNIMPDFWTHIIGGEKVLEGIGDQPFQEMVAEERNLFNFGCQGPDFFFYNDFWPWIKRKRGPEAGKRIQLDNITELFLTSAEFLKASTVREEFPLAMTHFTGFLAHYVFDRNFHPFINYKTTIPEEHKLLEVLLDCYFIEKYWEKEAYLLSPAEAIELNGELPPVVHEYFSLVLTRVHSYPRNIGFIEEAYLDMKRVLGMFYCPHPGGKRFRYKLLNLLLPINLNMFIYPVNPDYSKLKDEEWQTVEGLFNKAVKEGINLLKAIFDFLEDRIGKEELISTFPEISFEGEPWERRSGYVNNSNDDKEVARKHDYYLYGKGRGEADGE